MLKKSDRRMKNWLRLLVVIVVLFVGMVMPTMAFLTTGTKMLGRPVVSTVSTQRYATMLIKNNNNNNRNQNNFDDEHNNNNHQHQHHEKKNELKSLLPPIDPSKMSKLEIEFRQLLEGILYTQTEIDAIANPRIRCIYQGISASYYEPAVYRAFEVLYEDYMPLRIAGRLVYSRLQHVMEESNLYRKNQFDEIISTTATPTSPTNLSADTLQGCWLSYIHLVQDRELQIVNGDGDDNDGERLLQYIANRVLTVVSSSSSSTSKTSSPTTETQPNLDLNRAEKESLTFSELITTLYKFASEVSVQNTEHFLLEVFSDDWGEAATAYCASHKLDEKRAKFNARYDEMIHQFHEWKDFIPNDKEGRRIDILKGCFVGSENPDVVQALRIIYTDNAALRLSGDWIFKVVSTIMKTTIRRRERRKN